MDEKYLIFKFLLTSQYSEQSLPHFINNTVVNSRVARYFTFTMGKYKKYSEEIRESILKADDPYYLGKELGVPKSTICNILKRGRANTLKRGGANTRKLTTEHTNAIEKLMEVTGHYAPRHLRSFNS